MATPYASNVFINCPFDHDYLEIRNAIVFAVLYCGFVPRCALEEDDSGAVRFEKIRRLIDISKYAIHDISRTELDNDTNLPRFNMPFELGVFIGASSFGDNRQKQKNCLILEGEPYGYQKFISDIAGHDIRAHDNNPEQVITLIRNWLGDSSGRRTIPGGSYILRGYRLFKGKLSSMCRVIPIEIDELTYNDYRNLISEWLVQDIN